MIGNTNIIF